MVGIFAEKGFTVKVPVPISESRVLGLQMVPGGRWVRRGPIPELPNSNPGGLPTVRDVLSWKGQLVSHQPVGGWLRLPSYALARLVATVKPENWRELVQATAKGRGNIYDVPVTLEILKACLKLRAYFDKPRKNESTPRGEFRMM